MAQEIYVLPEGLLEVSDLILKHLQNEISGEEQNALNEWIAKSEKNKQLFDELMDDDSLQNEMKLYYESKNATEGFKDLAFQTVFTEEEVTPVQTHKVIIMRRMAIAASLIGFIILASYFVFRNNRTEPKEQKKNEAIVTNDVLPGKQGAVLTLADGSKIYINDSANQNLATQGSTQILSKDGKLIYSGQGKNGSEILYNTLATSRGQMYPIVLSDNSRIWLNSESSIKYPVAFVDNERRVEITGEAYFEIAHDASKPFIVSVNGTEIKVLGTKFNVNAYSDEDRTKTTLLEGSVLVKKGIQHTTIKPGQQAQVSNDANNDKGIHVVSDINTAEVIAWKNGLFNFDGEDIPTALRQLARWYNIDIVYAGEAPKDKFMGEVERNLNLSQALKILERAGLQFTLEGKKLIVKQQ